MTRPVRSASRFGVATFALALALGAAACSGASTASSAAPAGGSAAASAAGSASSGGAAGAVTIQNFAFNPASVTASVGSTVTWTNQDNTAHTVTADDGSFDSKNLANGKTFSQTFSKAGTFSYHCSIHSQMKATVVVS